MIVYVDCSKIPSWVTIILVLCKITARGKKGHTDDVQINPKIIHQDTGFARLRSNDGTGRLSLRTKPTDEEELEFQRPLMYFYENDGAKCTRMDPIKYKSCFICPDNNFNISESSFNKTVCYSWKSNPIASILQTLARYIPDQVTNLLLLFNNSWSGGFAYVPPIIDLSYLRNLVRMEKFELKRNYTAYLQQYDLIYGKDTFKALPELKVLILTLPIRDQSLASMLEPLKSLEYLELTDTFGISMQNMIASLSKVNNETLKKLHLNTFQLIGANGYSGKLNLTTFLSNRIFPKLESFKISNNSISSLLPGIYKLAPNLKHYDISGNILLDSHNNPALLEGFLHPSVEVYLVHYQGYIGAEQIPQSDDCIANNPVQLKQKLHQRLSQDFNDNSEVHGLSTEAIGCYNAVTHPPNISEFMTKGHYIKDLICCLLPEYPYKWVPDELFPPLKDIFNPHCMALCEVPLGPNLSTFAFSFIHFEASFTRGFKYQGKLCVRPNKLKTLSFSHNAPWMVAAKLTDNLMFLQGVHGLENLEKMDFSFNKLDMDFTFFTKSLPFPSLKSLNLAGNIISMPKIFAFCGGLKHLTNLDLSFNNQNNIPIHIFKNCEKLETVSLAHNSLKDLSGLNLDMTDQLRELDLSYNSFPFLTKSLRSKLEFKTNGDRRNLTINLSYNPLVCGCKEEALEFTTWIVINQKRITFTDFNEYHCTGKSQVFFLKDLTPEKISQFSEECFPDQSRLSVISILLTLLCVSFLLVLYVAYRKRWKIRYNIYKSKQSMKSLLCKQVEDVASMSWSYDAFVSYCADDRFWVHDVLMKTLEMQYGFNLCIHYRDFPIGGGIAETIITRMEKSRELIIVISDISLSSDWCQFELMEALRQSQKRCLSLIIIKLGNLSEENMARNATAAHLLDMHTYLEWSGNPNGQKLFWAKLVGHLYSDAEGQYSCYNSCCHYGARSISYDQIQ